MHKSQRVKNTAKNSPVRLNNVNKQNKRSISSTVARTGFKAHRKIASSSPQTQQSRTFRSTTTQRHFRSNPIFGATEDQQAFYDSAKEFADKEIAPFAQKWDQDHHFPKDMLKKAADMGFASLYVRDDVGGAGLGRKDSALIFEALATGCPAATAYLTVHNMCCWMVDSFGTEEQRQKYSPKLATFDQYASYCLTEPGAGSDAASLTTRAVKDGNEYVLDGTKAFITGGGTSDIYLVMARTGGPGPKGISTIIVPKDAPGLSFGANERKMGWNCSPTSTVNFDGVRVPLENLLGGEEGKGFTYAMKGLDGGRVNIAALSIGGAQAAIDRCITYVAERKQFGKPIGDNQWVQFTLADMVTKLTASRLMVHRAAEMIDQGHPEAGVHCAMAKKFATEACSDIADKAIQLHGGYGYLQDFPLEKISRDLRVHQILEGTNQIMNVLVARAIAKP